MFSYPLNLQATTYLGKKYKNKQFSFDLNKSEIIETPKSISGPLKVGLLLESVMTFPATAGLPYKVYHLSPALVDRGIDYVFYCCNRNFEKYAEILKTNFNPKIKVHIIPENKFYQADYMSALIKKDKVNVLQIETPQTLVNVGLKIKKKLNLPVVTIMHDLEDELMETLGDTSHNEILDYTHYVVGHLSDVVVTLTQLDKDKRIKKHGLLPEKIFVTPIGVDKTLTFSGPNVTEKNIIFLGNLYHKPNRNSIEFLIKEVFPIVKKAYPDAKIKVIGLCPSELKEKYHNKKHGVIFYGKIIDQKLFLQTMASGTLGLCCVDSGCGMNVKVANYCAIGLPVILTPLAYPGYEAITSLSLVSYNKQAIAEEIKHYFSDKTYTIQKGKENCKLIWEHLSWKKIAITMEQALLQALDLNPKKGSLPVEVKPIWLYENRCKKKTLQKHYVAWQGKKTCIP